MTDEKTTTPELPYWASAAMRKRATRTRLIAEHEAIIERHEADAKALDGNREASDEAKGAVRKLVEVHKAALASIDKAFPDTPEPEAGAAEFPTPTARREARDARRVERRDRGAYRGPLAPRVDADASESEPSGGTEAVRVAHVPSVLRLRQLEREVERRKKTVKRYPEIERHKDALVAAQKVLAEEQARHEAEAVAPTPDLEAPPRAPEPVADPSASGGAPGAPAAPRGAQPSDTTITPGRPPGAEGGGGQ